MKSLVLSLLSLAAVAAACADDATPHLRRQGTATQLIVDGRPLLMRAGELGNSSGEPEYLRPFWSKLKALNLNTVIAPVYWDVIEPAEGQFDFGSVDGMIDGARQNGMHLVLLWFGSWKNSMSCYAPAWVKRDPARFPRSRELSGRSTEILSPFATSNRDTDARAFATLMRHLREVDGAKHTVVLIQVENEIGMIPDARDHADLADRAFAGSVPAELMTYLTREAETLAPELRATWNAAGRKTAGTWREVFGDGSAAEEIFMAWYFALYTDEVARRGKAEYPLPMYVNAALIRPGHRPGQYPSAGPLPQVSDIWRAGAPAIDFLAPDIYFQNFAEWLRRYTRNGNPVFVPEAMRSNDAAVNALYAFAGQNSMGFGPFGIESITEPAAHYLTQSYDLVAQLTPLILEHQGRGSMAGLLPEGPEQRQPQQVMFGDTIVLVSFERTTGPSLSDGVPAAALPSQSMPAGGLIVATAPDEFVLGGIGITAVFQSRTGGGEQMGILSAEVGRFVDGKWEHVRFLNGDETNQGRHIRIGPGTFGLQRVKLYRYR